MCSWSLLGSTAELTSHQVGNGNRPMWCWRRNVLLHQFDVADKTCLLFYSCGLFLFPVTSLESCRCSSKDEQQGSVKLHQSELRGSVKRKWWILLLIIINPEKPFFIIRSNKKDTYLLKKRRFVTSSLINFIYAALFNSKRSKVLCGNSNI